MEYLSTLLRNWLDSYLLRELAHRLTSAQRDLQKAGNLISRAELEARKERDAIRTSPRSAEAKLQQGTYQYFLVSLGKGDESNESVRSALSILFWRNFRVLQIAKAADIDLLLESYSRHMRLVSLSYQTRKTSIESDLLLLPLLDEKEAEFKSAFKEKSAGQPIPLRTIEQDQREFDFLSFRADQARQMMQQVTAIKLETSFVDLSAVSMEEVQRLLSLGDRKLEFDARNKVRWLSAAQRMLFLRPADERSLLNPEISKEYAIMRGLARECLTETMEVFELLARQSQQTATLTDFIATRCKESRSGLSS